MFKWFSAKCPVSDQDRDWIESSYQWLTEQFGLQTMLSSENVVPDDTFFPFAFDGTDACVRRMVHQVCVHMKIPKERFILKTFTEKNPEKFLHEGLSFYGGESSSGAAGYYSKRSGDLPVIALESSVCKDPELIVAVTAHELAHIHLLEDERLLPRTVFR